MSLRSKGTCSVSDREPACPTSGAAPWPQSRRKDAIRPRPATATPNAIAAPATKGVGTFAPPTSIATSATSESAARSATTAITRSTAGAGNADARRARDPGDVSRQRPATEPDGVRTRQCRPCPPRRSNSSAAWACATGASAPSSACSATEPDQQAPPPTAGSPPRARDRSSIAARTSAISTRRSRPPSASTAMIAGTKRDVHAGDWL